MYYEAWFDLEEAPFSIAPDPRYLYFTRTCQEAAAHLIYGIRSQGGFVMVTGEVGTGKTTLCRAVLGNLPDRTKVAYILNPKLTPWEFFATICDELGIDYPAANHSHKLFLDRIQQYLLSSHAARQNTVLLVDEAQNINTELLEHLRLLTNLETAEKKLLQIILVGQPELREMIDQSRFAQMAQRITARFHLGPLNKREMIAYVKHRLKVAGTEQSLFTRGALYALWRKSRGVPRVINVIADRALLGAYTRKKHRVDRNILRQAAAEVTGKSKGVSRTEMLSRGAYALTYTALVVGAAYLYFADHSGEQDAGRMVEFAVAERPAPASGRDDSPPTDNAAVLEGRIARAEDQLASLVAPASDAEASRAAEAAPEATGPEVIEPEQAKSGDRSRPGREPVSPLFAVADPGTGDSARAALLALWGYNGPSGDLCDAAKEQGLACLTGAESLERLAALDRPAELTLYDRQGQAFAAALLGLSADAVLLEVDGAHKSIPRHQLSTWWYGEFRLPWRPPPRYRFPVRPGQQGEQVVWLAGQLAAVGQWQPAIADPRNGYGAEMEQQVRLFQRQQGLLPDGVVGPMTIIAFQNAAGTDAPRLARGWE